MSTVTKHEPQEDVVLAKAVLKAGEQLGLKQQQIARVLGIHRTAVSRLRSRPSLDPASKQGELAILLIRLGRSLSALTGGDEQWIRLFMSQPNKISRGVPQQQIESVDGLVGVLHTVDALRGKI